MFGSIFKGICVYSLIVFCHIGLVSDGKNPLEHSHIIEYFIQHGWQKLDNQGTLFTQNKIQCILTFQSEQLAAIEFFCLNNIIENNEPCCFSEIDYQKLITFADQLKPLGKYTSSDPVGVITPSGWSTWSEEYAHADIVRIENSSRETDSNYEEIIKRFTIFYWLTTEGKIKKIWKESNNLFGRKIKRYYVTIEKQEFEISGDDYNKISKGMKVKIRWTLGSRLSRIQ